VPPQAQHSYETSSKRLSASEVEGLRSDTQQSDPLSLILFQLQKQKIYRHLVEVPVCICDVIRKQNMLPRTAT
jgi:hypothetical protein